jgi:hypothetical protein
MCGQLLDEFGMSSIIERPFIVEALPHLLVVAPSVDEKTCGPRRTCSYSGRPSIVERGERDLALDLLDGGRVAPQSMLILLGSEPPVVASLVDGIGERFYCRARPKSLDDSCAASTCCSLSVFELVTKCIADRIRDASQVSNAALCMRKVALDVVQLQCSVWVCCWHGAPSQPR